MANGIYMTIDGKSVPEPARDGITITDEPIWSSNTGRMSSGKMAGDLVAWKKTIEVTWPMLSVAEAKAIHDALKDAGAFFEIAYYDLNLNTRDTMTVYCGNLPRTLRSLTSQNACYTGIKVKFVEQ